MGGLGILGLLVVATTVEFQDGGEVLQGPDPSNLSGTGAWYFGTIDTFTLSYSSSEPNSADNPHGNNSGNDEDRLKIEDENGTPDQSPYCHAFVRMPIIEDWILPESTVSEAKLFIY